MNLSNFQVSLVSAAIATILLSLLFNWITLKRTHDFIPKNRKNETILNDFVSNSLFVWSGLNKEGFEKSRLKLNELDDRFENLKKIQTVFLNCYFDSGETLKLFNDLSLDEKTDFSRYNYFYAKYLERIGKKNKAKKVIENSLEKHHIP